MATSRTFNDMIKEYMPYKLLMEETVKRTFALNRAEKVPGWNNDTLYVPFQGGAASSFAFGELVATTNVSQDTYVKGSISAPKELWGTMKFLHRDLMEHGNLEKSFLKLLPATLDNFIERMKELVSLNLLNGSSFAALGEYATDGSDGVLISTNPERFEIDQEVIVNDGSSSLTGFVRGININTGAVTFYDARVGGNLVNFSTLTEANMVAYNRGALTNGFNNLSDALLSYVNGGSETLYGQTKTAYPYLQALNISGASITATNILEKLFDAYVAVRKLGKGAPTELVMSYKNLGSVMKLLETSRDYNGSDTRAQYGWTEIDIIGIKGKLTLVGVNEMPDDKILVMDWRGVKFHHHSDGFFKRHADENGNQFYVERATTGYTNYIDIMLFGDLVVTQPSHCGIIHTISY